MVNDADRLTIWQQNINKLPTCQHTLLSNDILITHNIDIIALQEPAVIHFNFSIASKDWISIYPSTHSTLPGKTRMLTLIHAAICTDLWEQIDFPSGDITVVKIKGEWSNLSLYNIYNKGKSNETLMALKLFHSIRHNTVNHANADTDHTMWVRDFNQHHPHWDNPNNMRLFTVEAIKDAKSLIETLAMLGLEMALPSCIPTHLHNITKRWLRLDQVFISDHSIELIEVCDTKTHFRSINTDHLPVVMQLNLKIEVTPLSTTCNF